MSKMPKELREFRIAKNTYQDGPGHFEGVAYDDGFTDCFNIMSERESSLIEVIKMQKEALEFYGNDKNYTHFPANPNPDCMDFVGFIEEKETGGGAREALAKVEEQLKKVGIE